MKKEEMKMIRISEIKPLGEKNKILLTSIVAKYLELIKSDYNPLSLIEQSLNEGNLRLRTGIKLPNLTVQQTDCLTYLRNHFDEIIIGNPENLFSHINAIDNTVFGQEMHSPFGPKFQLNDFGKGIYQIFGYEDYFRAKVKKGIWLAKKLNIKTCPYCNAQYTLVVTKDSKSFKARFQFDHFFSKKRYPYLSISMFNLIPCCAPCNLSKGDIQTNLIDYYHPYHNNLSLRSRFIATYPVEIKKLSIGDVKGLNIKVSFVSKYPQFNTLTETHNKIFEVDSSYNRHIDIVEDLLYKKIIRNSSFKSDVMKIRGLFNGDDGLYKRYLIGNYALENEILDRPLSKFTQDISKQLEII